MVHFFTILFSPVFAGHTKVDGMWFYIDGNFNKIEKIEMKIGFSFSICEAESQTGF
jgi:hypothetical protein